MTRLLHCSDLSKRNKHRRSNWAVFGSTNILSIRSKQMKTAPKTDPERKSWLTANGLTSSSAKGLLSYRPAIDGWKTERVKSDELWKLMKERDFFALLCFAKLANFSYMPSQSSPIISCVVVVTSRSTTRPYKLKNWKIIPLNYWEIIFIASTGSTPNTNCL